MNKTVHETLKSENISHKKIKQLYDDFSGKKIYIPKTILNKHKLLAYGEDTYTALCKYYSGKNIYIAKSYPQSKEGVRSIADYFKLFKYISKKLSKNKNTFAVKKISTNNKISKKLRGGV